MKISKISSRIEFFVLVLLLLSLFFILRPNQEKKATSGPYFIDLNASPGGDGTLAWPWKSFDNITWGTISSGETIYVHQGTYSPSNPIDVQVSNITFRAEDIYVKPVINDSNLTGNSLISLNYSNSCSGTQFEFFEFECANSHTIVDIAGQNGNEITDVLFYYCWFKQHDGTTMSADYADNLMLDSTRFEFFANNSYNEYHLELSNTDEFSLVDTYLLTEYNQTYTLDTFLYIDTCTYCDIRRNEIYTYNNDYGVSSSAAANYGVHIIDSDHITFVNNVVWGAYRYAAFYDDDCTTDIVFNHNTIINEISNDTYGGNGYQAVRSTSNPVDSFRNNILFTVSDASNECYPIYIAGTSNNWKPSPTSMCDYNAYYNDGGNYMSYWSGSGRLMTYWTGTLSLGTNSVEDNPNFYNHFRMKLAHLLHRHQL